MALNICPICNTLIPSNQCSNGVSGTQHAHVANLVREHSTRPGRHRVSTVPDRTVSGKVYKGDSPYPENGWPAGYRRPKPWWTWAIQLGLIIVVAAFVGNLSSADKGWGLLAFIPLLLSLAWFEWTERCENRLKVYAAEVTLFAVAEAVGHHTDEKEERRRAGQEADRLEANHQQMLAAINRVGNNGTGTGTNNGPAPIRFF